MSSSRILFHFVGRGSAYRVGRRRPLSIEPLEARALLSVAPWGAEAIHLNPDTHTDIQAALVIQDSDYSDYASAADALAAPSRYDLRDYGDVTTVKNQGGYGTCWAFATFASLESSLLKASNTWTDFSERNLAYRHGFDWGYSEGGNSYLSEAYLSRFDGPIYEIDDPYLYMGTADNVTGPVNYYVREMLRFDTRDEIKNAVMTGGAVYTHMYWSSSYYRSSDYTYHYAGSLANHAVTIIGWDDAKVTAGGVGAWLVKNSWGTGWGDGGYFWLSYQGTGGRWAESFRDAVSAETYSKAYYYDTFGDVGEIDTPYAFNRYVASSSSRLKSVGFYTAADGANYTISVYDTFSGGRLSNLLASVSGTQAYAGYHTVDLSSVVSLYAGNDFYVSLHITNGGDYSMAIDYRYAGYTSASTASAGESYYSYDGVSWYDLTTWNATANFCIKALVLETTEPGPVPVPDSGGLTYHGDFNGDGTDDVLGRNLDSGLVRVWFLRDGAEYDYADIGSPDPAAWQIIGVGDFNGDGTDDILWQNQTNGSVGTWIISNGRFSQWIGLGNPNPAVWQSAGIGDFNGDGTDDILWHNQSNGTVGTWILSNGRFSQWIGIGCPNPTIWHSAGAGDFNGDGTDDILWVNQNTGLVGTWIMSNGRFNRWIGLGTPNPNLWHVAGIGDFNGDATDDILWQHQTNGTVGVWILSNGNYNRWIGIGNADAASWRAAGVGDYNGDGTSDVLWHNRLSGSVNIWFLANGSLSGSADLGYADPSDWRLQCNGAALEPVAATAGQEDAISDRTPVRRLDARAVDRLDLPALAAYAQYGDFGSDRFGFSADDRSDDDSESDLLPTLRAECVDAALA